LILADDFLPLFGIEMARYTGRADEVAEQHRQMTALALRCFPIVIDYGVVVGAFGDRNARCLAPRADMAVP
jgi:hypothetical protein